MNLLQRVVWNRGVDLAHTPARAQWVSWPRRPTTAACAAPRCESCPSGELSCHRLVRGRRSECPRLRPPPRPPKEVAHPEE